MSSFVPFLKIPRTCDIIWCLSLSEWFCSVWQSLGPSILLQIGLFHSFFMAGETGEIIYPSKVYIAMFFSLVVKLCVCSVQSLSRVQLCDPMDCRPPCPSPTPRVDSDLRPFRWWCHPTISSSVAHTVKNPPATWKTWVWSLDWEDPLEEDMATHSSILVWRIPWIAEPGGLQSVGSERVEHEWGTKHVKQRGT